MWSNIESYVMRFTMLMDCPSHEDGGVLDYSIGWGLQWYMMFVHGPCVE